VELTRSRYAWPRQLQNGACEEETEQRVHADWLLEGIIEPVLSHFPEFTVKRADQDPRPGLIDSQMINDLLTADLVIADLTFQNPNAFYEIGIRHMAQKPIIHMQLANEKTPFDVSLYRAIKFSRARYKDLDTARLDLKAAIEAVLAEGYQVENPVTNARGYVKLQEHATSTQRLLVEQIQSVSGRFRVLEDRLSGNRPLSRGNITQIYVIFDPAMVDEVQRNISSILPPEGNIMHRWPGNWILEFPYVMSSTRASELIKYIRQIPGVTEAGFPTRQGPRAL
jgi:hypothetical protein